MIHQQIPCECYEITCDKDRVIWRFYYGNSRWIIFSSIVIVIVPEPGLPKESTTEAVIMSVPTDSVDIWKELSSVARGTSISGDQSNWVEYPHPHNPWQIPVNVIRITINQRPSYLLGLDR